MGRGRRHKPKPLVAAVGAAAFGAEDPEHPAGAASVGAGDAEHPLRGALYVGNDPKGAPRGSEAFGSPSPDMPLRGALLFGNDPEGAPRGSDAFGGSTPDTPLRGALLFGNDPAGSPRGSDAFGLGDAHFQFRGSQAVGAPELMPERLYKDEIGYDFGGVRLHLDESSLAGIRKDPSDRLRLRVVGVLQRALGMEVERMRHGIDEDSIPWGKLRRDPSLDRNLAEQLREAYRRAPGERLGIGHVRDLLEDTERMHTFTLVGDWENAPGDLRILWDGEPVAHARTRLHRSHRFYALEDLDGTVLAYVDAIEPHRRDQRARVRGVDGTLVGALALVRPEATDPSDDRFRARIVDAKGNLVAEVVEDRRSERYFLARLVLPTGLDVGRIEDRFRGGKIHTSIEVDVSAPRVLAWALGAVLAELAHLRRRGWPSPPEPPPEEEVESVAEALGPRRRRPRHKG